MVGSRVADVRVEWGPEGLAATAADSDVVVIVDVLSFSTCVDVALTRGAIVFPFDAPGEPARAFALRVGAECAGPRGTARFTLSPESAAAAAPGQKIVLPSPNGAALSLRTGQVATFTAGLRNAAAVAEAAQRLGRRIAVIAAGERWPSGALRPALEDWLGAGALVAALGGAVSPEAAAARHAFEAVASRLEPVLLGCTSGRELVVMGYPGDVAWAAALNASACAPILRDGAFVPTDLSR
jgi:2-phosphosulfolactate phosphatase